MHGCEGVVSTNYYLEYTYRNLSEDLLLEKSYVVDGEGICKVRHFNLDGGAGIHWILGEQLQFGSKVLDHSGVYIMKDFPCSPFSMVIHTTGTDATVECNIETRSGKGHSTRGFYIETRVWDYNEWRKREVVQQILALIVG